MAAFRKKAVLPHLQAVMVAIQTAMREHRMDVTALCNAIGMPLEKRPTAYNWVTGKNGVGPDYRAQVAQVLGLTEEQLTSPHQPGAHSKRPPKALGPAQRAVALAQSAPPGAVTTTEPVRDVFTISGRSDGQISLRLSVTLDATRGLALARFLMDAGLVVGGDSARDE